MPFDGKNFHEQVAAEDDVLRTLQDARHRITNPEDWCKSYFAANGAVCALGALEESCGGRWIGREYLLRAIPTEFPHRSVIVFNDDCSTTHADVLALFDRAIAARRAEP